VTVTSASRDSDLQSSHEQLVSTSSCQAFIDQSSPKTGNIFDHQRSLVNQHGSKPKNRKSPKTKTMVTGKRFKEMDSVNYHVGG
jgi:hypothetical protein